MTTKSWSQAFAIRGDVVEFAPGFLGLTDGRGVPSVTAAGSELAIRADAGVRTS